MLRTLICLIAAFSFLPSAHAELYQWTDAQGRKHFSDKKPEAVQSTTVNLSNSGSMRDFELSPAQPEVLRFNGTSRLVLLKPIQLALTNAGTRDPIVGSYYFGPDCVSPSSATLKDWRERYPEADPLEYGYAYAAADELNHKGLRRLIWIDTNAPQSSNVMLNATITDMQFATCARKTKLDARYSYQDFKHSAARLGVKWTFRNAGNQKIIYETSTEGVANIPAANDQPMNQALTNAFGDATRRLMQDAAIDKLMILPEDEIDERTWLDKATQLPNVLYDRYIQSAKLAEILALLSAIKPITTEYYLSNGHWPSDFAQLQISPTELSHPGRIASVRLRGQGEIVADISPAFGAGAQLMLIPSTTMADTAVQWQCAAILDSPELQQWLMDKCAN